MNRLKAFLHPYKGAGRIVCRYWRAYGGYRSLVGSPYFHLSILLTWVTHAAWSQEGWWNQITTVIPSLLGFSLGGLAIFLSFGNEKFLDMMSGRAPTSVEKQSPFIVATAALTHFVVVQVVALLVGIVASAVWLLPIAQNELLSRLNSYGKVALWGVGYWLYIYAICSAAAALFAVFRVATWFDEYRTKERSGDVEPGKSG